MACSGRRLPDLWTEATPRDCLPARAAMTVPNGVLLAVDVLECDGMPEVLAP